MKNNKLISYKEDQNKIIDDNKNKHNNWIEDIKIREDKEKTRLKNLKQAYDNEEIYEEDISYEDMEKLIEMYEEETEQLNQDTLKIKIRIQNKLKQIKR